VVFGLAATGVYALYSGFIQPWMTQLDQAGFSGSNLLNIMIFQGAFWKGWQSMLTLIEVLALVTVGGFAIEVFRRRFRRGWALAPGGGGLWGLFLMPGSGSASEMRKSDTVHVSKGEKIQGDTYLMGTDCRMDGEIDGDLFVFCQSADVNGHVTGDVIGFAKNVRINAPVDGNIRAACNNLTLNTAVGKNILAAGESIRLDSDAKIGGSLTGFGTTISIDGSVGRDILSFAHLLNINGNVSGSVKAEGETLAIGSSAQITGKTEFEGKKAPEVAPEAKL